MTVHDTKAYVVVIDTENYAGNFERDMCAYITGQFGECEVGSNIAELEKEFIKNYEWFEEHIVQKPDEHGCHRPCSIWETPGWFNNGSGGHFKDVPENEEPAKIAAIESTTKYYEPLIKRSQDMIDTGKYVANWTKEACENAIKGYIDSIESGKNKPLGKYHAYLSVAIFFDNKPPKKIINEIVRRAMEFVKKQANHEEEWRRQIIKITSIRILEPPKPKSHKEILTIAIN